MELWVIRSYIFGDYSGLDEYNVFLQDLSKNYFEDIAININSFIEKGKISHLQKFIDLKIDTFKIIENNFNENFHWGIDNLLKQIQEEIQEYAMSTPMPVLYYAYWSKFAYKTIFTSKGNEKKKNPSPEMLSFFHYR